MPRLLTVFFFSSLLATRSLALDPCSVIKVDPKFFHTMHKLRIEIGTQSYENEVRAYNSLRELENNTTQAHFLKRHGAQTTLDQHFLRIQSGQTPDGKISPTALSTRFKSFTIQLAVINKAVAFWNDNPRSQIPVTIRDTNELGEGYYAGDPAVYVRCSEALVLFDNRGHPISAYPAKCK